MQIHQIVLSKSIDTTLSDAIHEDIFMKAIHLTENAGIFIYYKSFYYAYPIIQIKEWNGYAGLNNFKSFGQIQIDKYFLNPNFYVNDIVKINSSQIYFSSISQDKKTFYIVKLSFYNEFSKFVIRYYTIRLYELYGKKS